MSKKDTQTWLIVAIAIIAIVVILFYLWQKKAAAESSDTPPDTPPDYIPGEGGDTDPPMEPGLRTLQFDKTVRDKKSITWWLSEYSYAPLLTGTLRPGGAPFAYTNVKIYIENSGKWKHVKTVSGYPGSFVQFEVAPNMKVSAVKWEAEQGLIAPRYIDEVHAQLYVEA